MRTHSLGPVSGVHNNREVPLYFVPVNFEFELKQEK